MKRYDMFVDDGDVCEEDDPHGDYYRVDEVGPYIAKLEAVLASAKECLHGDPDPHSIGAEWQRLSDLIIAACDEKEGE